jgi:hypothetical protein
MFSKFYLRVKRKIYNAKLNYLIFVLFFVFSYILYQHVRFYSYQIPRSSFLDQLNKLKLHESIYFYSKCYCQKEIVQVDRVNDKKYKIMILNLNGTIFNSYFIEASQFESSIFTCDLYNVLRRGPNQRIFSITYSYHESKNNQIDFDNFFFSQIENKMKYIYINYPLWNLRVYYYKSAISQSNICKKQCLLLETNKLKYGNVDFCDSSNLPYNLKYKWDFSYLSSDILGWLPIGDDFVQQFLSMDFNYPLEKDGGIELFNKWQSKSTSSFFFNRHNRSSYLWGFSNKRDSYKISKKIFNVIVDVYLSGWYSNKAKNNLFNDFILPLLS